MVILRSGRTYTTTAGELLVSTEQKTDGSVEIPLTSEQPISKSKRAHSVEPKGIGIVEENENCKRVKVDVAESEESSQQVDRPSPHENLAGEEENLAQVLARCAQEDAKPEEVVVPIVEAQESLPAFQIGLPLPVRARESGEREGGGLIVGQNIAVDRFYINDRCEHHFLTHAHVLINRRFISWGEKPIYCSQLTARLLPLVLQGKALCKIIRPLEVGKIHSIDATLQVTLLDANHCPGSVMFLFEGSSVPGGSALVTGHFRADSQFMALFDSDPAFVRLSQTFLSTVYVDATCFDETLGLLPERKESEKKLVGEINKNQVRTIIIPIPKVGMEDTLAYLSQELSEPILVSSQTLSVSKLCGVKGGKLVANGNDANFRIRTLSVTNMWSR
ncbi:unnamed protein product [Cylicostephanus goldi]|uniref:Uncharacterized protein n=1 Tax=Cylicostephanus goldi TaxID=71465 RepID=A0A3P6Q4M0_CYLGO|nr:unnamed protein product [Cylicostephanus goldi]